MNNISAQIDEFGKTLQIRTVSLPKPNPHEIQVKIHYAGINFYEILFIKGTYSTKTTLPCTVGGELSGEVIAVGSKIKEFKKGDRVFSFAQTGKGTTGSYATYANINEKYLYHLPSSFTYEQGAAFPMIFFTAYTMLTKKLSINPRATILVHSGAGGVGGTLIQLTKTLYPHVTVLSTCSQKKKEKIIKALGADIVIKSTQENFIPLVQKYAPDGLDVIFDPVGQALFDSHIALLKPFTGIICSYGAYSGPIQDTHTVVKLRSKNLTLTGFLMWPLIENKQWCQEIFNEVIKIMQSHSLSPRIDTIIPLSQVNEAILYIKQRKNTGKILLACM